MAGRIAGDDEVAQSAAMLDYIAATARELAQIVHERNFQSLAHLIAMVEMETNIVARKLPSKVGRKQKLKAVA